MQAVSKDAGYMLATQTAVATTFVADNTSEIPLGVYVSSARQREWRTFNQYCNIKLLGKMAWVFMHHCHSCLPNSFILKTVGYWPALAHLNEYLLLPESQRSATVVYG